MFILNCFAEQLMFKITFIRMREERNWPREVKNISRKMLKKRQNEVKRNTFLFDEVKKHSRTSPDVPFKEFSLTKQKTRPRMDY